MAFNNHHKSTSPIATTVLISIILPIAEWFDWKGSNPIPSSMKTNMRIDIHPIITSISLSLERLIHLSWWRTSVFCNLWVVIRGLLSWKWIREVSRLALLKRSLWVIFHRSLINNQKHRNMWGKLGKRMDRTWKELIFSIFLRR